MRQRNESTKIHTAPDVSAKSSVFTGWEREFADSDLAQKILEGWPHIRKAITNEKMAGVAVQAYASSDFWV